MSQLFPQQTLVAVAAVFGFVGVVGCSDSGNEESPFQRPSAAIREVVLKAQPQTEKVGSQSTDASVRSDGSRDPLEAGEAHSKQVPTEVPRAQRVRLPDDRPEINEARLKALGIRVVKSKRLVLLTDRPDQDVAALPQITNVLFEELEQYFGELPAAADGSDFQVTGHLIVDPERFEAAGLMPSDGLMFRHGRHLNHQFWMRDQQDDYYRRHLLLHEFTHCFMMCETGVEDTPEAWYIEGMAEYFATHGIDKPSGDVQPGVLPESHAGFDGWGRITELRRAFDSRPTGDIRILNIPSLANVRLYEVPGIDADSRYAWWWALCWLINEHPFYRQHLTELRNARGREAFFEVLEQFEQQHGRRWQVDWLLFAESLREGFDARRAFATHAPASSSLSDLPLELSVSADRGWQDSGVMLSAGDAIRLRCEGDCVVAVDPVPWKSEPQGVTVEYANGAPLGQVMGILVSNDGSAVSNRVPVGRRATVTAPWASRLWLQINDNAAAREDNSGTLRVLVSRAAVAGDH